MNASIWSGYFIDLSPEEMVKTFSEKGWTFSELSDENANVLLERGKPENVCSGDQAGFIKKAGHLLKALHVSDNEGITDQHILPFGRGTINWELVMSALKEINYQGLFNFEIPGENNCPLEIRVEKLDYIKKIVSFLYYRM